MELTIFEPRLKFKPRLKFFKFGLRSLSLKTIYIYISPVMSIQDYLFFLWADPPAKNISIASRTRSLNSLGIYKIFVILLFWGLNFKLLNI